MHSVDLVWYCVLAQHYTSFHPFKNSNGIIRPPRIIPVISTMSRLPVNLPVSRHLKFPSVLDSTSPGPVPPPSSTSASEAAHDNVDERDATADDSLKDGTDAVNDSHDAGTDGAEDGFDLQR